MLSTMVCTAASVFAAINMYTEYKRCMMMMQQNSYRTERYMRWLRTSGDSTSYWRIAGMCIVLFALASFTSPLVSMCFVTIFSLWSACVLVHRHYKKPLVWTRRVWRIFFTMLLLSLLIVAGTMAIVWYCKNDATAVVYSCAVALSALFCASHVIVMVAIWLLAPVEKHINRKYYNEAADILSSMPRLKVIGVTGSYGKTSTKHYLYRILSEKYDVLMTPGSYNTTLGVIRTVREMMKPYCEVFICEMGAKQIGDIKEICDLVHPQIGIVTAVGPQHLESFKTIENVQRTKFELVDALPADGLAVVNDDFPFVASRKVDNVKCLQ